MNTQRYKTFTIMNSENKMLYRSRTISSVKRYIKKEDLPIDLGLTGLYVKCGTDAKFIRISIREFYDRTGAGADEPKIMQQEFCSNLQALREAGL